MFINNLLLYWTSEKAIKKRVSVFPAFNTIFHLWWQDVAQPWPGLPRSAVGCMLWWKSLLADREHPSLGGEPALCYSQVKGSGWGENQSLACCCLATAVFPPSSWWVTWDAWWGHLLCLRCPCSPSSLCSGSDQEPENEDLFLAVSPSNINPCTYLRAICAVTRILRANNFSCRHIITLFPNMTPEHVFCIATLSRSSSFSQGSRLSSKPTSTLLFLLLYLVWRVFSFVLFWPSPAEGVVAL